MDGTAKSIVRGRIAECVLGLCLVIAALMRPEIGAQLPAFLADLYVGPAAYGTIGLVWALMLLAGVGLLGGFQWTGTPLSTPSLGCSFWSVRCS